MNALKIAALIAALKPNCSDYVYVSATVAVGYYGSDYVVTDFDPNTGLVTHEITTSSIPNAAVIAARLVFAHI